MVSKIIKLGIKELEDDRTYYLPGLRLLMSGSELRGSVKDWEMVEVLPLKNVNEVLEFDLEDEEDTERSH